MPCDPFGRTGAIANCVIRKEVYLILKDELQLFNFT